MLRWFCLAASVALLVSADVSGRRLPPAAGSGETASSSPIGGISPQSQASSSQRVPGVSDNAAAAAAAPASSANLPESARLQLLRYLDGEFARVNMPLPGAKKGVHIKAGQAVDKVALEKALTSSGAAVNRGDSVQITRIDFIKQAIVVEVNGGGKVHWSWREHLQGQIGLPVQVDTTMINPDAVPPPAPKTGATLYIEFGRAVPYVSVDQVKQYLAEVLDFTKQRSAATLWVDTLPPEIKQAIKDKRPTVGMDREEVLTALGRPERKVRERNPDGQDIEDWIYGHPPSQTTFVRFTGEKVSQIDQYP